MSPPQAPASVKWADELRIYGEGFVGRQEELEELDRAWEQGGRIFVLHAEGGAGKTRVVVEWLRRMRDDGWRGARRVFVHSFYSQGSDERRNASSELFFQEALAFFGYQGEPITQADEQGRTLARLLVEERGLLVLDGLEPLQHPPHHAERGQLKDLGIRRLLLSLANLSPEKTSGLCLITSRQPVVELEAREGASVVQRSLDHLHRDDGAELLKLFQVVGPDEELRQASVEFHGHAYSLMLLGSFLKNATDHHDIRRRREVVLLEEDTEHRSHARKMFAAYVRHLGASSPEVAILRLLGFFDRAAERQLLDVLRAREAVVFEWVEDAESGERRPQPRRIEDSLIEVTASLVGLGQMLPTGGWPKRLLYRSRGRPSNRNSAEVMSGAEWLRVLNRLRALRLIELSEQGTLPAVDAHPLLREYFAEQVKSRFPMAWQAGHSRLFEYLAGSAPYWPEGIENLQPLYRAVAHGCRARLHSKVFVDVYIARIQRGTGIDGHYSTSRLGAIAADFEAVACFFEVQWTTLPPYLMLWQQEWLYNSAAFYLSAMGRLTEAVEPLRFALTQALEQANWRRAMIRARNLSYLELLRGEVAAAITTGERSVMFAKRADDDFQTTLNRATLANALHQAGRRFDALRFFGDAESRQARFFHYDLLLSDAEQAAWQRFLLVPLTVATTSDCDAVLERTTQTLGWHEHSQGSLVSIALDHLTFAQASLYKACSGSHIPQAAFDHSNTAIDGLRASGRMAELPRGLLTRAWLRFLTGDEAGCRADLDEAWEIAERGPMPLFQADIQLYRARLFHDRVALAEAGGLIEKHGYHRRDEELADAELAAAGW